MGLHEYCSPKLIISSVIKILLNYSNSLPQKIISFYLCVSLVVI
ncbi:hypothetical protein B834_1881 [Enterococcus mundtii 1A]|nr:hypothetical protein [Enterococcus mundtii 1A]